MEYSMQTDWKLKHSVVVLKKLPDTLTQSDITRHNTSSASSSSRRSSTQHIPEGIITPRATPSPMPGTALKRLGSELDGEYEVEDILGYHKSPEGEISYLVKWRNWPMSARTWEPISNLTHCSGLLLKTFEHSKPKPKQIAQIKRELESSLVACSELIALKTAKYSRLAIDNFSESSLEVEQLFTRHWEKLESYVKEELDKVLRLILAMADRDPGVFHRGQLFLVAEKLCSMRREQVNKLEKWSQLASETDKYSVAIENNEDFDVISKNFQYISEMRLGEGVVMPDDPVIGCKCGEDCATSKQKHRQCCGPMASFEFAYSFFRRVRIPEQSPIYECNKHCQCTAECKNRVVQHGRKVELCIFKTRSCGWSVKTKQKISKGSFVCEYLGELIPDKVANVRDVVYYKKKLSYMFDLDFSEESVYSIDATYYGNVARFINHSCEPNLVVYPTWIDCLDPNIPRLAFFATRNIAVGEEINFDYENTKNIELEPRSQGKNKLRKLCDVQCQCGASKCRGWVFGSS